MTDAPLWISEAEVVSLMELPQAIDALEAGLAMRGVGTARLMAKTHVIWGDGDTLHAIGAVLEGAGYFGMKSWGHTAGGAMPLLLLWRVADGSLAAVIEAFALGQLRTGGMSGLATRLLASPDADCMALIGTGKQAAAQVAAVAATRRLTEVRVFSPTPAKRDAFAASIEGHGFRVRVAGSVEEATDGAGIVTTVTRSREPFLKSDHIARGAHINAVGAITPEREELAQDVVARACAVVVDDPDAAGRLSRELMRCDAIASGRLEPLERFIGAPPVRTVDKDISIFKAMGTGLSDVSLGVRLLAMAHAAGLGRLMPPIRRAQPRLFPSSERTVA